MVVQVGIIQHGQVAVKEGNFHRNPTTKFNLPFAA